MECPFTDAVSLRNTRAAQKVALQVFDKDSHMYSDYLSDVRGYESQNCDLGQVTNYCSPGDLTSPLDFKSQGSPRNGEASVTWGDVLITHYELDKRERSFKRPSNWDTSKDAWALVSLLEDVLAKGVPRLHGKT